MEIENEVRGTVSDGNDHVWLGDKELLADGGWGDLSTEVLLQKRMGVDSGDEERGARRRVVRRKEEEDEGESWQSTMRLSQLTTTPPPYPTCT